MPKPSRLATLVVTGALAGCGGSSGGGSPTAPTPTPTPAAVSVTVTLQIGAATASTAADDFTMSSGIERLIRVQGTVAAANGFADVTGNCTYPGSAELPLFEPIQIQPGAPRTIDEVFRLRQPFTGGPFGGGTITCSVTGRGQDGTAIDVEQALPFLDTDVFVDPAPCVPGDTTLCALDSRFRIEATWRDGPGQVGPGRVQDGGRYNDGGYFWFFQQENYNLLVQVIDQCQSRNQFWVFMAGQTDVQVDITVTDTQSGIVRSYANPLGNPFQPVQDTSAFATCP